jgi:hypothetical protein
MIVDPDSGCRSWRRLPASTRLEGEFEDEERRDGDDEE